MFLITITKDEIAQNFQSVKMEEFNVHGLNLLSSQITFYQI
jgi:hypothetical protein